MENLGGQYNAATENSFPQFRSAISMSAWSFLFKKKHIHKTGLELPFRGDFVLHCLGEGYNWAMK